ncbi:phosphotransferase [Actinopolymorpha alba]|uniref:phosphotransferase n=1 Tax=Actinopolymorpha alba TaxID=533267 RepID=UPI000375E9C3|nr:phosphotransferase [Actinopolymorpha alba]
MSPYDARTRVWKTAEWRTHALAWTTQRLADLGLRVTGPAEQPHLRPWSTLLRVPTSDGPVWLKASGPGTAYEPRLLASFGRWRTPHVLTPLAVDLDRGWCLLPDAGTSLRSLLAARPEVGYWVDVLPTYAELQRGLTPRTEELLAIGVPDLRPEAISGAYVGLLADTGWLRIGAPDGLSVADAHRLRALASEVSRWARQLAAVGIPPTLQHDDFHDGNVFVRQASGGPAYVFLDWGDASFAHPFGSLLASLRNVASRLDVPMDAAELQKLRDAYLEPWSASFDRADLLDAVRWATQLAKVGRALAWQRALAGASATERATYAGSVPGWLGELLTSDGW